jgi:CPA1 family monovalent cation:H+ antiporter
MELSILLAEEGDFIEQELSFVFLLAIAALVTFIIRRVRLPYTVALVLAGLLLSASPDFLNLDFISSQLILALLVPPLLFEATLHIKWDALKDDLVPVLLLAVGGTLIGTFIIGGIVFRVLGIELVAAIAFGALISATDPVAVIAFFRSLGVSKRLSLLVEGESLFNDGVAVVIFNLSLVAGAAISRGGATGFDVGGVLGEFIQVAFGGLGVGLILGYAVSRIILKNIDDHLIEIVTSVALAFGSYTIAERLHLSGILAVVAAGLLVGNIGMQNTSPTTKLALESFWESMAFAVNSLVFLVIGLQIEIAQFSANIGPIIVAVLAVLLSRTVVIYGLTWINNHLHAKRTISLPYRHVMYWGGLRGAISLALALTLTGNVFGSEVSQELRVMAFGVVVFTILVQGTTIKRLISRLNLDQIPARIEEQQQQQATLYAKWAGKRELRRLWDEGVLFRDTWEALDATYEDEINELRMGTKIHLQKYPELEMEVLMQARVDLLRVERSAISEAARRGLVSNELHQQMAREADNRLAALELIRAKHLEGLTRSSEKET